MKVELIPVLELPMPEGIWEELETSPQRPHWKHAEAWNSFLAKTLKLAGYGPYNPVSEGVSLYRATDISQADLRIAIDLHIIPLKEENQTINDSCALFGGLALFVGGQLKLIPQCCSTIADIMSWQGIVRPDFKQGHFCPEGHPMPEAIKVEENIEIRCHDEGEEFDFPAPSSIVLPTYVLQHAVQQAVQEVSIFAKTIDSLYSVYNVENLSQILVWGT